MLRDSAGQDNENLTASATFLNEGKATIGVWLPLALSDLMTMLMVMLRAMAAKPEQVKIPERSQTLASWCLPMMSRSLKADEDERKALQMFETVTRLKRKHEDKR